MRRATSMPRRLNSFRNWLTSAAVRCASRRSNDWVTSVETTAATIQTDRTAVAAMLRKTLVRKLMIGVSVLDPDVFKVQREGIGFRRLDVDSGSDTVSLAQMDQRDHAFQKRALGLIYSLGLAGIEVAHA